MAGSLLGKLAGPFRGQVHLHKFLMNSLNGTRELMKGPNVHSTAVSYPLHTLLVLAILDPTILFELNFCIMNAVP